jgi:hypothetical protein
MPTTPIVPSVVGHQAERAIQRDVSALAGLLARLDGDQWRRATSGGGDIVTMVAHLAEGAARLAHAWQHRVDAEADMALLHTFDAPHEVPAVEMPIDDHAQVLTAYRRATDGLSRALSGVRQEDWSWPVWSPLGGVETLGEAARRWLSHHHVHRSDVHEGLARSLPPDEDTSRLAAEFVLDALARRGGDAVTPPFTLEVVTRPPGAGTWTLIFERPRPRGSVEDIWEALVGHHPEALEMHRVEHGGSDRARVRIKTSGEALWRVAFRRGGSWNDLEVYGDDEGRRVWERLVDGVAAEESAGIGPVQH